MYWSKFRIIYSSKKNKRIIYQQKSTAHLLLNKSFGINNPTRFDAIKEDIGAIGCSKSHLEVLNIARKNNLPYVLICEDDIKFLDPDITIKTLKIL